MGESIHFQRLKSLATIVRPTGEKATCKALDGFREERCDAFGFGDDYDAAGGDGEAAGFVFFGVEADAEVFGDVHALVDDARRILALRPMLTCEKRIESSTSA